MPEPVARPAAGRTRVGTFAMLGRPRTLWRYLRSPSAPFFMKALAVLAVLYVIMPIDAVPDFAPLIGWIDDAGIGTMVLTFIAAAAAKHENERLIDATASSPREVVDLEAPPPSR